VYFREKYYDIMSKSPKPSAPSKATVSGAKRSRDEASSFRIVDGFAVAHCAAGATPKPLSVQPPSVFQALAVERRLDEEKNAFDRYKLSGLVEMSTRDPANPKQSPTFYCNGCGDNFSLSVSTSGSLQYSALLRHLRSKHPLYVLPKDADAGKDIFAATSEHAAEREAREAERAEARDAKPAAETLAVLDKKAVFDTLTSLWAEGYLVDGKPAHSISHLGERRAFLQLANLLNPSYDGGVPSYYHIDKRMVAAANQHMATIKKTVALLWEKHRGFIPLRYGLRIDKWSDGNSNDILGVVVNWVTE
jgi:hypothetical protein